MIFGFSVKQRFLLKVDADTDFSAALIYGSRFRNVIPPRAGLAPSSKCFRSGVPTWTNSTVEIFLRGE